MIGTVKWFDAIRGFGFIRPENGSADVFVHVNEVVRGGMVDLKDGQKINYEVGKDRQGRPAAVRLRQV